MSFILRSGTRRLHERETTCPRAAQYRSVTISVVNSVPAPARSPSPAIDSCDFRFYGRDISEAVLFIWSFTWSNLVPRRGWGNVFVEDWSPWRGESEVQNCRSMVERLPTRDKAPNNMNAGVSGFKNAIVTRGMVVACGALSLVLAARGDSKLCSISYQKVIQRLELWRLVMAPLVFSSIPELMFGLYLLYFFRVFERQVGSTKYMFFVLFTTAITTFLELVFIFVLKGIFLDSPLDHISRLGDGPRVCETGGAWRLYPNSLGCSFSEDLSYISSIRLNSGPIGLIFSCFVSFFFDIPVSTSVKLLGVEVSEKSFVYFVGLQLLLWSWMQSLIPGVCGVVAGLIYRYDVAGVQEIGFSPGAFGRMACRVAPFFSGISPEMAYRMNPSRSTETESRNGYPHEIGVYAGASTVQVTDGKLSEPVALGHNQKDAT